MDSSHSGESDSEEFFEIGDLWRPTYVLVALDTHPNMFMKREFEEIPFKAAVDALCMFEDQLIFSRAKKCPLGVLVAADEEEITIVADLEQSAVKTVSALNDLKNLGVAKLRERFERKADFDLSEFMLFCKKKLNVVKGNPFRKVLVYVTNDDDPAKNEDVKRNLLRIAENFDQLEMSLHVITFDKNFDLDKFYVKLQSEKVQLCCTEDSASLHDKLSTFLGVRDFYYKSKFHPFKWDKKRFLNVIIRNPVKHANISNNVHISKDEHRPVLKEKATSANVDSYLFKYSKDHEPIKFTPDEKNEIFRNKLPEGFALLCVTDKVSSLGLVYKESLFMQKHPKEKLPFFDIFWKYCHDKNKVLLCSMKRSMRFKTNIVELSPLIINKTRTFLVKYLPSASDIHYPEEIMSNEEDPEPTTSEEKNVTEKLIDSFTFDYFPDLFPNVPYRRKKEYIKSEILGRKMNTVEDVEVGKIDDATQEVMDKFERVFSLNTDEKAKKREAPNTDEGEKKVTKKGRKKK